MASSSLIPHLFERNAEYAKTHQPAPFITEFPPGKGPNLLIISCCDGRFNPETILGLRPGEALVIRNVGGDVPRNLIDLLMLNHLRHGLEEILVLGHTDCGVTYATDEEIHESLKQAAPEQAAHVDKHEFRTWNNDLHSLEERTRNFVNLLKANPFISKELSEHVVGAVFDVKTGKVTPLSE